MKVKELILKLQECDPERVVIMQKDSEGNGYSPLSDVDCCSYEAVNTWSGEIQPDDDVGNDCVPCVVLTPIN